MKTSNRKLICNFIVEYLKKQVEIPTPELVALHFPDIKPENVETTMNSIFQSGELLQELQDMQQKRRMRERALNTNRPDENTAHIVRSGVKELPRKVIEAKAYPVDVLKAKFEDGMTYRFAFIVDHSRGFDEYNTVKNQNIEPIYSEYGESLVSGMFKNWN